MNHESSSASGGASKVKYERVLHMLSIPLLLERFLLFSELVCVDTFIGVFTVVPFRFFAALWAMLTERPDHARRQGLRTDILRGILLISLAAAYFLDGSQAYHWIRAQNSLKLYVIFNVLEVLDRLMAPFGQDMLGTLFSVAEFPAEFSLGRGVAILFGTIFYICAPLQIRFRIAHLPSRSALRTPLPADDHT